MAIEGKGGVYVERENHRLVDNDYTGIDYFTHGKEQKGKERDCLRYIVS